MFFFRSPFVSFNDWCFALSSFKWHMQCVCMCLQTAEWLCWLAAIKHRWLHSECHEVVRSQMTHSLTLYRALWWCPILEMSPSLCPLPPEWWAEHHGNMWQSWKSIIPNKRPRCLLLRHDTYPSHRAGVAKGMSREVERWEEITINLVLRLRWRQHGFKPQHLIYKCITAFNIQGYIHNNTGLTRQIATLKFNKHHYYWLKKLQPLKDHLNGHRHIL